MHTLSLMPGDDFKVGEDEDFKEDVYFFFFKNKKRSKIEFFPPSSFVMTD